MIAFWPKHLSHALLFAYLTGVGRERAQAPSRGRLLCDWRLVGMLPVPLLSMQFLSSA